MELDLRIDHDAPTSEETLVLRALLRITGQLRRVHQAFR